MGVDFAQIKTDIERAIQGWRYHAEKDRREATARVTAFLAQCETDQARLTKALVACQALVEFDTATDPPDDLRDAIEQAHAALADNQ